MAMSRAQRRMHREQATMERMIALYCSREHAETDDRDHDGLCRACADLRDFARRRLSKCPYQEEKPTCAHCPIHCYKPDRRRQMKDVMRIAGPRMLWRHPIFTIRHMIDGRREAPPPPSRKGRPRGPANGERANQPSDLR
jgi:hypothetical protein